MQQKNAVFSLNFAFCDQNSRFRLHRRLVFETERDWSFSLNFAFSDQNSRIELWGGFLGYFWAKLSPKNSTFSLFWLPIFTHSFTHTQHRSFIYGLKWVSDIPPCRNCKTSMITYILFIWDGIYWPLPPKFVFFSNSLFFTHFFNYLVIWMFKCTYLVKVA